MEKENNEINIDDQIKKCLKSYLMGKKYMEIDKDKSFEYFKQTLKYLSTLKNKDVPYKDILLETESECNKYISLTVEQTIEKPKNIIENINLFELIEKGNISALKKIKPYELDFHKLDNDGNTPIHKAIKYGDTTFLKMAFKLGASIDITNKFHYSALEFACLERDPNMINFLLKNGSDMKKHLYFRDGEKKYSTSQNFIDCSVILKIIFRFPETEILEELKFVFNHFKPETKIGFDDYNYSDLIKCLSGLLLSINADSKETYINIIRDELNYPLKNSLGCPYNKLEILLTYLNPFLDYPFNISEDWYINLELKYIIIKLLKEKPTFNSEIKNNLINYLWENYVKNNLYQDEYLGNLISQWVSKIKVK